jgi:hypothetical protein
MTTTPVINEHTLIEWRLNSLFPSDVTLGVHYEYKERERERERDTYNEKETCQMSSQELICRGSWFDFVLCITP